MRGTARKTVTVDDTHSVAIVFFFYGMQHDTDPINTTFPVDADTKQTENSQCVEMVVTIARAMNGLNKLQNVKQMKPRESQPMRHTS